MVLREQRINNMESDGFAVVDSWETYVSRFNNGCSELITCRSYNKAGAGKSTLLYVIPLSVFFEVIHSAY